MSARAVSFGSAAAPDTTLPAGLPPTSRLGKYLLTGMLGEGAMGVVYRALDPHIDRVVAIKTLRKSLLDTPTGNHSAALRFRNEARAAGRLSHPGIVAIHEYGEDGEQGFIVMEYVEGASLLRCTIPRQRLPLADVLSVCAQLLHALNYAHAHGVWHRDIKPSNLLVTPGGQLKITDFGIARIDATVLTQDATVMGSCGYMAPECYQGVELDRRVDLFACGVLLHELLTGRRPFKGVPGAVMHQLLHQEPPSLVSAACDAEHAVALAPFEPIVARSMARDRDQRYASAQEMLDDLMSAAGGTVASRVSVAAVQGLLTPLHAAAVAHAAPATGPTPPAAPAQVHVLPRKPPSIEPGSATPVQAVPPAPERQAASTTPDISGFDPAELTALASMLVETLGPIARVVVRRAAARSHGLAELVVRVADELPIADEQRRFIEQAHQKFGSAAVQGAHLHHRRPSLPATAAKPLSEEAVQRAQAVLTHHFGPIARVMVTRARSNTDSRERFIAVLTELAADCIDPQRLRVELDAAT
jgi:eukaryotic-like serine/threonine-protein kinase